MRKNFFPLRVTEPWPRDWDQTPMGITASPWCVGHLAGLAPGSRGVPGLSPPRGRGWERGDAHLVPYGVHVVLDDFGLLLHACREQHARVRCRTAGKDPKIPVPAPGVRASSDTNGSQEQDRAHRAVVGTVGVRVPASSPSPARAVLEGPGRVSMRRASVSPRAGQRGGSEGLLGGLLGWKVPQGDPDIPLPPPQSSCDSGRMLLH